MHEDIDDRAGSQLNVRRQFRLRVRGREEKEKRREKQRARERGGKRNRQTDRQRVERGPLTQMERIGKIECEREIGRAR